jgi:hypothetical protein
VSSLLLVGRAMPNALRILVHLAHAVERHPVNLPLGIRELKSLRALRGKVHLFQRDQDDPALARS